MNWLKDTVSEFGRQVGITALDLGTQVPPGALVTVSSPGGMTAPVMILTQSAAPT